MNRANEIRDVLKRLTSMADQTGCSIVLIGHLSKAAEGLVRERLSKGTAPVTEIQSIVKQAGISPKTLDIAKKNMRDVIPRKEGRHWKWVLIR